MPVSKITLFGLVAVISAMAACNTTSPPEPNTQTAKANTQMKIYDEGKDLEFYKLQVNSIDKTDNAIEGFKKTPSGLQYRILREGTGATPTRNDGVTVHYKGQLVNGTEFDSSYKRRETITFQVTGVIPGWTEGLQLISEGGMIELIIPHKLAYDERGQGRNIPPAATLQFIVELQQVN